MLKKIKFTAVILHNFFNVVRLSLKLFVNDVKRMQRVSVICSAMNARKDNKRQDNKRQDEAERRKVYNRPLLASDNCNSMTERERRELDDMKRRERTYANDVAIVVRKCRSLKEGDYVILETLSPHEYIENDGEITEFDFIEGVVQSTYGSTFVVRDENTYIEVAVKDVRDIELL